jgi:hypothetical protein
VIKLSVTILELAEHLGVERDEDGSLNAGEIMQYALPFMGGCQGCEATIACYNAYPSKTGYLRCHDCIATAGFDTAEDALRFIFEGRTTRDEILAYLEEDDDE